MGINAELPKSKFLTDWKAAVHLVCLSKLFVSHRKRFASNKFMHDRLKEKSSFPQTTMKYLQQPGRKQRRADSRQDSLRSRSQSQNSQLQGLSEECKPLADKTERTAG